ncbi:MAG: YraN family protein [Pseudomonadota bacterium]
MGTNKRTRAEKLGKRAEWLAALALIIKGYRIVERRYKTKLGEIDLIARKGDLVILVEVKARPTPMEAVDAVTGEAKRRISNAGDLWLARQRDFSRLSIRHDIIAVCPRKWPVHFKDAW